MPADVRTNIEAALEKPTIEPNYRDSLDPTFVYFPDPGAAAQAPIDRPDCPGIFTGWGREREVTFMRTVLEATGSLRVVSAQVNFPNFTDSGELTDPNQFRYNVTYEVALTFVDSTMTPPTRTDRYGATAKWDLIRADLNSSWMLKRWEDIAPTATTGFQGSIGILKIRRAVCSG